MTKQRYALQLVFDDSEWEASGNPAEDLTEHIEWWFESEGARFYLHGIKQEEVDEGWRVRPLLVQEDN